MLVKPLKLQYLFRLAAGKGTEILPYIFGGVWPAIPEWQDSRHCAKRGLFGLFRWNDLLVIQGARERWKSHPEHHRLVDVLKELHETFPWRLCLGVTTMNDMVFL